MFEKPVNRNTICGYEDRNKDEKSEGGKGPAGEEIL